MITKRSENTPSNMVETPQTHNPAVKEMMQLGKLHVKSQRYEEALSYYDCAISIQPTANSLYYYRGVALFYLNRYERAISNFERALSARPWNIIDILNYTSCIRYRMGDTKLARKDLQRIISAKNGNTQGLLLSDSEVFQLTAD